jgi:hypothetical protein
MLLNFLTTATQYQMSEMPAPIDKIVIATVAVSGNAVSAPTDQTATPAAVSIDSTIKKI